MIDLHCHSTVSDGAFSPEEVVQLAHQNGCTMLALTDHDHTGGVALARAEAQKCGMRLISGVEISVTWRSQTIHIVGLDFDENHAPLQDFLAEVRKGRIERLARISEKLEKKQIFGVFDGALALAHQNPEMVSRTHIAAFLVEQGHVRNKQQAFTRYLGTGKCASVPHQWADLAQAIEMVAQAGGVTVIAHPMHYDLSATGRRNLFQEFKSLGGLGIEVHSGNSNHNDTISYSRLAERYDLLASCGSDFHRFGHYGGGTVGKCPTLPDFIEPIWSRFH